MSLDSDAYISQGEIFVFVRVLPRLLTEHRPICATRYYLLHCPSACDFIFRDSITF